MPLVVLVSTDTKMRRKGGGRCYTDRHGDRFFPPPLSGLWTDTSRLNTVQQEKTTIWDYITVSSYSFNINNNGSNRNTRLRQKEEAWRVPALDRKGQIGVKGSRRFAPHVPEQLSAKEAFRSSSPREEPTAPTHDEHGRGATATRFCSSGRVQSSGTGGSPCERYLTSKSSEWINRNTRAGLMPSLHRRAACRSTRLVWRDAS